MKARAAHLRRLGFGIAAALLAPALGVSAAVHSDQPSAVLTYPYIRVDSQQGVDTFVQIGNTNAQLPVTLMCFYENANSHCATGGEICASAADCSSGDLCVPQWHASSFSLTLTAGQPLGWRASQGLTVLPLGAGSVPPVPEDPMTGSLRCLVDGIAATGVARNVLVGHATVEEVGGGASGQPLAAEYNAIGFEALTPAADGDAALTIGGDAPEYAACPGVLEFAHPLEGASEPVSGGAAVHSTLVVVPCGADYARQKPDRVTLTYEVTDELDQRLSSTKPLTVSGQLARGLSAIDPVLFDAGVRGTFGAHTRVIGSGGVVGVLIETRNDVGTEAVLAAAARAAHQTGEAGEADSIVLRACAGDCNGDGAVDIAELVNLVSIGLGMQPLQICPSGDTNGDQEITVDEIVTALGNALRGCP